MEDDGEVEETVGVAVAGEETPIIPAIILPIPTDVWVAS